MISDYAWMQELLTILHMSNYQRNQWLVCMGWGMGKCLQQVVFDKAKDLIQRARCILISCDEVTTLDHQSWVPIHRYVMQE